MRSCTSLTDDTWTQESLLNPTNSSRIPLLSHLGDFIRYCPRLLEFSVGRAWVKPPHFLTNFKLCHLQSSSLLTSLLHSCTCLDTFPCKFMYSKHSFFVLDH